MLAHFLAFTVVSYCPKIGSQWSNYYVNITWGSVKEEVFTLSLIKVHLPVIWLQMILEYESCFFYVLSKEDYKKRQISFKGNFMRNGGIKALSQLNSHLQQAVQQKKVWGGGSTVQHEVYYFAYVILTSCIKDHENLAFLENNIPLKFWPSVSRMISAIVVNLLDTVIN